MPKQLANLTLPTPGVLGLNKQMQGDLLPPQWATTADNCVIDDNNRLAARKGFKNVNATSLSGTVRQMWKYVDQSGGSLLIFAANNKIYKDNGDGTYTDISGTITTPTSDNWQFQNFNGKCLGFQAGHAPIVLSTTGGTFADIVVASGTIGTPDVALAAYGRIWTIVNNSLKYCALLDETHWTTGAGSFDLSTVWPTGSDIGTGLADFNGNLVIFGKNSIVVYSNPWTPSVSTDNVAAMSLVEALSGIGCLARDSIVHVGGDILFLSDSGVRSFGRTIQEKSMPERDLSKNIRTYLVEQVRLETKANIKATYSEREGFYLLSLPGQGKVFCFDMRATLEDGSVRVTEWALSLTALLTVVNDQLYFGQVNWYSFYNGYLDDIKSDSTGGDTYDFHWRSGWFDLTESEAAHLLKLPKTIGGILFGGQGQTVTQEWAFDFDPTWYSALVAIPTGSGDEWNVMEWGEGEWSGGETYNKWRIPAKGSGTVIALGVKLTVNNSFLALQRLDMLSKIGRMTI